MTALRKQAFDILEGMPDDKMVYVINYLNELNGYIKSTNMRNNNSPADKANKAKKLKAWNNLQKYAGIIDRNIDVKAELEMVREEKYARFS